MRPNTGPPKENAAFVTENCGKALVVDGDEEARGALSRLLERAGFEALEADSGEEGLAIVRAEHPWLVLLEVTLPGINGYEMCRQLREEHGEKVSIVFLSGDRTDAIDRTAGLLLGGDDYIVEPFDAGELLARVRRLNQRRHGEPWGPRELEPEPDLFGLTERELDVLRLLASGSRTRDISATLGISMKTVSGHVQRVLAKLGVNTRTQAVVLAYESGLVGGVN
jgi:DNA-binding response OmpR family regulator